MAEAASTERYVFVCQRTDRRGPAELGDAWRPVLTEDGALRVFVGTKQQCIAQVEQSLGEPTQPGSEVRFRAPSVSSWRGERIVRVPDHPKPERLWEDE
jgi:hypothetical protein